MTFIATELYLKTFLLDCLFCERCYTYVKFMRNDTVFVKRMSNFQMFLLEYGADNSK